MCMVFLHSKYYIPSADDVLFITSELRAKHRLRTTPFLFYFVRNVVLTKFGLSSRCSTSQD